MRRDLVQRAMAHDLEAFTALARLSIDKLYAIAADPPRHAAVTGTYAPSWQRVAP